MQTPQEEKYLLPWNHSFNETSFPINVELEVHDLVFPDRATPWVNDVIVYSFNITNLTDKTFEINHTLNVVSPIFEPLVNTSVMLEGSSSANLNGEKVTLRNEGINEVDITFQVPSGLISYVPPPVTSVDNLTIQHYVWTVTQETEDAILFGRYGEVLTLIVLIPSTIIALKNLKDLVTKSTIDEDEKRRQEVSAQAH
jgi:hypothetical protein